MLSIFASLMVFGSFISFSVAVGFFLTHMTKTDERYEIDPGPILFCIVMALVGSFCFIIGIDMIVSDVMFYRAYG